MSYGIVYKATNIVDGKSYIGRTVRTLRERKNCHLSASKNKDYYKAVFYNAIRKHEFENFVWQILECCDDSCSLSMAEEWYIRYFRTKVPYGYNMSFGGGSNKGWKMPEESRLKIKQARFGTKQPLLVRRKISESNLKVQYLVDRNGNRNGMYGKRGNNSPTAKKYVVTFPDGREECIVGIRDFSRKEGLDSSSLVKCAKGKYGSHKGYRCRYY